MIKTSYWTSCYETVFKTVLKHHPRTYYVVTNRFIRILCTLVPVRASLINDLSNLITGNHFARSSTFARTLFHDNDSFRAYVSNVPIHVRDTCSFNKSKKGRKGWNSVFREETVALPLPRSSSTSSPRRRGSVGRRSFARFTGDRFLESVQK